MRVGLPASQAEHSARRRAAGGAHRDDRRDGPAPDAARARNSERVRRWDADDRRRPADDHLAGGHPADDRCGDRDHRPADDHCRAADAGSHRRRAARVDRSWRSQSGPAHARDGRSSSKDGRPDVRATARRCGSGRRTDAGPRSDHRVAAAERTATQEPAKPEPGPQEPEARRLAARPAQQEQARREPGSARRAQPVRPARRLAARWAQLEQQPVPARRVRGASQQRRRPRRLQHEPQRQPRREHVLHALAALRPDAPDARAPTRWRAGGPVALQPTGSNCRPRGLARSAARRTEA